MGTRHLDEDFETRHGISLPWLVIGLTGTGIFLYKMFGLPHLPATWPTWEGAVTTLKGSDLPLDGVMYFCTTLAWLMWGWLAFSLALELVVVAAETASQGSVWAARLRAAANHLTAPLVRRVVDGAVVAAVVVNLVGRSGMSASAAPVDETYVAQRYAPPPEEAVADPAPPQHENVVEHLVQPTDTLWTIAERYYGTGDEFPRLVDANAGRRMADGARFTREGVIRPGWTLVVPSPAVAEETPQATTYIVQVGDTLWDIAARRLGDPLRWSEIFEMNRGIARHPRYGWVLTDANLIWPGLPLRLPATTPPTTGSKSDPAPTLPVTAPAPPAPVPLELPPLDPPLRPSQPVVISQPTAEPAAQVAVEPGADEPSEADQFSPLIYAAAGVAAASAAGAAAWAARRRRRNNSRAFAPAGPDPLLQPDFLDTDLARGLTHRLHGQETEPTMLAAAEALRFLATRGLPDLEVVMARVNRGDVTLTLSGDLRSQDRIIALADELGRRLGGRGNAELSPDHDVTLRLTRPQLATVGAQDSEAISRLCLLPIGITRWRESLSLNWRPLDHTLIVGTPGGGAEVVMTVLLATLAARYSPADVQFYVVADPRLLPPQVAEFPHCVQPLVHPTDEAAVAQTLQAVRDEVARRMRDATANGAQQLADAPHVVLAVGELADLRDEDGTLDLIATHGPPHGVHLLAATASPGAMDEATLDVFGTRLCLSLPDEDSSVALLGAPDAAGLSHGEVLVRVEGRQPIQARAFRLSPDGLEQLVRVMRTAYAPPPQRAAEGAAPDGLVAPRAGNGTNPAEGTDARRGRQEAEEPDTPPRPEPMLTQPSTTPAILPETGPIPHGADSRNGSVALASEPASVSISNAVATTNGHVPEPVVTGARVEATAAETPLITVCCLGAYTVRGGERQLVAQGAEGGIYKSWEVLAYLAVHPSTGVSRDRVAAAIWPTASEASGMNSLRNALSTLRKALQTQLPGLPNDMVRCSREGVCVWNPSVFRSDAQEFIDLCQRSQRLPPAEARAALEQALALYKGDLLYGEKVPVYAWVDDRSQDGVSLRDHYRAQFLKAALRLGDLHLSDEDAPRAISLYKALLQIDPTMEDAVRGLYRCYRLTGDLTALMRQDRALRQALLDTYADDDDPACYQPEPETVALWQGVRDELLARRGGSG